MQTTNWIFEQKIFDSYEKQFVGFVYLIINNVTQQKYIGRKYFKEIQYYQKNKKRKRRSVESNWRDYWGSSSRLQDDIAKYGKENFTRQILSLHVTKGDCNTEEVKQQFIHNVLEDSSYYNENINGKWHKPPDHIKDRRLYNTKLIGD
jgi:hypothetical protein